MDLTGLGAASDLGGKVVDFLGKIADRIWPDPQKKAEFMLEVQKVNQTGELAQLAADTDLMKGQLEINKIEAASTNWFVAGWRPAFGWIGALAIFYSYIALPFAEFWLYVFASTDTLTKFAKLPHLDLTVLWPLITGMLGIGAARTIEKVKNAEGNR